MNDHQHQNAIHLWFQNYKTEIPTGSHTNRLELLSTIDYLLITQLKDSNDYPCSKRIRKKYTITNVDGHNMFYATEDIDDNIMISDKTGNDIIRLFRPSNWLQTIDVFSPRGKFVGCVKKHFTLMSQRFTIRNSNNQKIMKIKSKLGSHEFKIISYIDPTMCIGNISTNISNSLINCSIHFPLDLNVQMKAVIIGAPFLFNFIYWSAIKNTKHSAYGNSHDNKFGDTYGDTGNYGNTDDCVDIGDSCKADVCCNKRYSGGSGGDGDCD